MARPSTYVLLLQAQQAIKQLQKDLYVSKGFTLQQAMDMAMIALHDEFGFGPKYQARFEEAFRKTFVEYATMCVEDGADDAQISYTKEKVDRALKAACGEIRPFEERYDEKNLYFRDSRKDWEKGSVIK